MDWDSLLQNVRDGDLTVDDALKRIRGQAETDLGFARVDVDRHRRRGLPEVIFCSGKTEDQVVDIVGALAEARQIVLATRAWPELYERVRAVHHGAVFHEAARAITLDVTAFPDPVGQVAVVTAGTSDIPVAEEACLVAERMGARVLKIFDVGVAGLHRLMPHMETLKASRAIVVAAGMEGALPSVIGGMVDRPVIAIPTSIGYGLNLQGVSALLAMLNTCVPGITVVNVDNGFGAGVAAALINRVGEDEDRDT